MDLTIPRSSCPRKTPGQTFHFPRRLKRQGLEVVDGLVQELPMSRDMLPTLPVPVPFEMMEAEKGRMVEAKGPCCVD